MGVGLEGGVLRRKAPLQLLLGSLSLTAVSCLVVDRPCCSNMLHVPAAFGPDLLTLESPIRSQRLVVVEPEDACEELRNVDLKGKVALIKRGNCNFTEKIFRVQQHEAIAAVVYDSQDRERWGTIMSGVEDEVWKVLIPSVFVSHSTGLTLKNASEQLLLLTTTSSSSSSGGGGAAAAPLDDDVLVTLNDTGHVKPKTKRIGPIETLATYVVVSLVLLSFSGCCGLLLALCVTCYQRAFRVRALRNLKVQTFKRPPNAAKRRPTAAAPPTESITTIPSPAAAAVSGAAAAGSAPSTTPTATTTTTATTTGLLLESTATGLLRSSVNRLFGHSGAAVVDLRLTPSSSSSSSATCCVASSANISGSKDPQPPPAAAQKKAAADTTTPTAANQSAWGDDDNSSLCAICLDEYEDGDTLRLLPCGHSFHDICIKPWLMEKSEACPMCKRPAFRRRPGAGGGEDNDDYYQHHHHHQHNNPFHAAAMDTTAALDDVGVFLRTNVSFFAMVLVAVITSASVLGAMAIVRPGSPSSSSGGGGSGGNGGT